MENLKITGSNKLPTIDFDAITGNLLFSGSCIPSDSFETFKPIIDWIKEYCKLPVEKTIMTFQLDICSTSALKRIIDIFKLLETIYLSQKNITVNWVYDEEDEDMFELGKDYESVVKIPFNFKALK